MALQLGATRDALIAAGAPPDWAGRARKAEIAAITGHSLKGVSEILDRL